MTFRVIVTITVYNEVKITIFKSSFICNHYLYIVSTFLDHQIIWSMVYKISMDYGLGEENEF